MCNEKENKRGKFGVLKKMKSRKFGVLKIFSVLLNVVAYLARRKSILKFFRGLCSSPF